jgi:hypothetical protein
MATDEPLLVCKQNRNQLATKKLIAPPDKLAVDFKEIVKKNSANIEFVGKTLNQLSCSASW